jgi:hypothetical protein
MKPGSGCHAPPTGRLIGRLDEGDEIGMGDKIFRGDRNGERLTWGDLVASSEKVFMPPGWGRRAGEVDEAIRQSPKRLVDAQREVRAFMVVMNRGESRGTRAAERGAREGPKGASGGARRGATERE